MDKNLDIIQTDRLILREINETDTPEIVEWRSNPDIYRFFKSPHKITVNEHVEWYKNSYLLNENRFDWMCIEKSTKKKIGVFGLVRNGNIFEINYLLAPDKQHKGYARESISRLVQYARNEWGADMIFAEIHKDNESSIRVVKKLDFELKSIEGNFCFYGIGG